jgi:hypothetical protein
MIRKHLGKKTAIFLACILIMMATLATVAFADTYTGYIDGYPYTYWFLRETTSQDWPCISTTFKYPFMHYSSAATYLGSERVDYSGRNYVYGSSKSSAFSSYGSIYAYTSAYYGTE